MPQVNEISWLMLTSKTLIILLILLVNMNFLIMNKLTLMKVIKLKFFQSMM